MPMPTFTLIKNIFEKNLISNYEIIKISNTSPASKFTQQKASTIRIKDVVK
jgi:hypothetical protein